ncbi:MAG TPA: 4Fe-4S ferredoxin, partial [Thermoleophilia bacterium]|nr:4Fe-4S ferredoxin [Thermoleophilia bacterium]
ADIKGSSPLGDIVKNFGVSQGELYRGLAIPDAVPLDTKLKDVQALMGLAEGAEIVVPENVRTAIGALDTPLAALIDTVGIPRDRVDETLRTAGLASDATVRQLMSQGAPGAVAYLISGEWPTPPPTDGAATDDPAERGGAAEEGSTSPTVRGTTTLRELKEMVEDYPAFLAAFDIPTDEPETNSLKDLVGKYGFDIPEVRAYVESDPGQPSG